MIKYRVIDWTPHGALVLWWDGIRYEWGVRCGRSKGWLSSEIDNIKKAAIVWAETWG